MYSYILISLINLLILTTARPYYQILLLFLFCHISIPVLIYYYSIYLTLEYYIQNINHISIPVLIYYYYIYLTLEYYIQNINHIFSLYNTVNKNTVINKLIIVKFIKKIYS